MGQLDEPREFMLITRATGAADKFSENVRQALRLATAMFPDIAWKAEFDAGPGEHVEVFSAPGAEEALRLWKHFAQVPGMRTEVMPLATRWEA